MRSILSISIAFIFSYTALSSQTNHDKIEAYLPEVVSGFTHVRDLAFSPDGKEIYFTTETDKKQSSSIMYIKKNEAGWSKPAVAPFSGKYKELEPFFSHDGLKLYFSSNRPLEVNSDKSKDFDIWYVARKLVSDPWSAPINLESPINSEKDEYYPSLSLNNNLYFTRKSDIADNKEDIFVSIHEEGNYTMPISVSDSINGKTNEFNSFIAPDESYILFSSYGRPGELGGGDLYISFKDKKNKWSKAKSLGSVINSPKIDFCPYVDVANKRLYFTSEREGSEKLYSIPFNPGEYRK